MDHVCTNINEPGKICPQGQLLQRKPNAFCQDLKPTPDKEIHIWYYKPCQKPVAGEIIGPKKEVDAVVLLYEHDMPIKFLSK